MLARAFGACLLGLVTASGAMAQEAVAVPGTRAPAPLADATVVPAPLPGVMIGTVGIHTAAAGENMMDIARLYDLGMPELRAANPGVDPWIPGVGRDLVLPTAHIVPESPRRGIVINLAELRLYYFRADGGIEAHAIGVGRDDYETPLGTTRVVRKQKDPSWRPTARTRADRPELPAVVPPGPDNPMGAHALYLGWPTYAMHGTNLPDGVGRRTSRGCIRLYPEAVADLFGKVAIGTPVSVVNQPLKFAWVGDDLYMEVHTELNQLDDLELHGTVVPFALDTARPDIVRAAGQAVWRLNWDNIVEALTERRGLPILITDRMPTAALDPPPAN